jgi:hypothetical protein
MASFAVQEATHLDEIGFPEFTTKLITDVFDALVASNIRQMEAFTELLGAVGKSLTQYINDTKDDIDGAQVLQFLSAVLPAAEAGSDATPTTKAQPGGEISAAELATLKTAVAVGDEPALPDLAAPAEGQKLKLTAAQIQTISDAVAGRIAANKYTLLQEMVRQGMLRLVVESGRIETRLMFRTYANRSSVRNANTYNRKATDLRAKASTGWAVSKWVNASASASRTSMTVSTTSRQDQSRSGTAIDIFAGVIINFKTDYLPLNV